MSIWNPNAFTVTGQPLPPGAPPALRVTGGQATPEQLAMAQAAFASFCMHARLSAVPNPTQTGRLPDGSPYRIVVVGPQTVMELQVAPGEDLPRRSGIGLSLTTLEGGLVPGHIHKDGGRPQPYILTPEVLRGTRKCTGRWRVRKVDGYSGGKAVWGGKAGAKFVAGVDGVTYDIDLMDHRSLEMVFGTNNRAYWSGEYSTGTHILTGGEKLLGLFRHRIDTLPFFRRHTNGDLWVMQITPVFFPEAKLQLYGEKYSGSESTAPIGELLHELGIPPGYTMLWQTISASPDGNAVRMVMRRVSDSFRFSKVDLAVSDATLAVASMADSGGMTFGDTSTTSTGDQSPNGTYTRTTVHTPGWVNLPGGYGYDAKGGKTEFHLREANSASRKDGRSHLVEVRTASGNLEEDGYEVDALSKNEEFSEVFPYRSVDFGQRTVSFDAGYQRGASSYNEVNQYWRSPENLYTRRHTRRTGTMSLTREDGASVILFADPLTDLYVTAHYTHTGDVTTVTDYTFVDPPGYPGGVTDNSTTTDTHTYGRRLLVRCRDREVLRVNTPLSGPEMWTRVQYVASSATDPLTGAVCVNVLEIDAQDANALPLRSWIILADDKGAKLLHEVMDVPESTDIRVKKDYALLSVV